MASRRKAKKRRASSFFGQPYRKVTKKYSKRKKKRSTGLLGLGIGGL